jgi:prepilin-type N-terminal cleavage/methylation domain-containing protein
MNRLDLRSESGYTLIELMIATVLGLIVATATLAIVISSVHLTASTSDRVDATQEGRIAMQKITQALESSCVSPALPPILPNTVDPANTVSSVSDANDVWFYSSLSDGATINPNLVGVSLSGGSLVMKTYAYSPTSGSAPNWAFSTTPTNFTLLPYATNATTSAGATLPVFAYYGYDSNDNLDTNLDPSGGLLTAATAATVAEVVINYQAMPSDGDTAAHLGSSFSDSVVLRLTPASGASTVPCS